MTMVASLAVCVLLVNICWAAPAPSTNDVLSGQDFLAVFMRSSQRTRSVPSSSYYINRNLIQHNKDGVDYELDRDDHRLANEDNVISSTTITKSTHIEKERIEVEGKKLNHGEEKPKDEIEEEVAEEVNGSTTPTDDDLVTTEFSLITTTEQPDWDTDTELPSQVVSVRVSSSVVRQRPRAEEKPGIATTQDEPGLTAAAIQRSHFGVEEGPRSVYKVTSDEPEERVSYSQEATVLRIEGRQSSSRRPLLTHHQLRQQQQTQLDSFAEASQEFASETVVQPTQQQQPQPQLLRQQLPQQLPQANLRGQILEKLTSPAPPVVNPETRSPVPSHQTVPNYSQAQALTYHPVDLQTHPGSAPVTYETSVTSATSGSRVQFYSEPAGYRLQAAEKRKDRRFDLQQFQEKVYGQPEKNYEVDEAVSVLTNGRAHGVQQHHPTPQHHLHHQSQPTPSGVSTVQTPEAQDGGTVPAIQPSSSDGGKDGQSADEEDDNNKFGYVVDDRNYRKYRVEEKTPDGFIVGEYGVVSHDDGSLRGVRYTADSTINPRLIYDALVKFLSLK